MVARGSRHRVSLEGRHRLLDPTGGAPRPLVSNSADGTESFYAAWSPDGRRFYLTLGLHEADVGVLDLSTP